MIAKRCFKGGVFLSLLFALLLASCTQEELDIKQSFNYEVTMQKFRTDVAVNKPVELVFFLQNEGNYQALQYSVSYFLRQGTGRLYDQESQLLGDNIRYEIQGDTLQIGYLPTAQGDHSIEIEFFDNFGLRKEITVNLRAD